MSPVPPLPLLAVFLLAAISLPASPLPLHAERLEQPVPVEAARLLRLPPPQALPPALVVQHIYTWDGMPISYRILAAGQLSLRLPWEVFSAWSITHVPGSGDIQGTAPGRSAVSLRIMLLPGGGPLGTLTDPTWQAYLAGLAPEAGGTPPLLLCNDDSRDNSQMLSLLGARTRFAMVDTVQPRGAARRTMHAAVVLPEGVALFVLEGSPDEIEEAQNAFAGLLTAIDSVP